MKSKDEKMKILERLVREGHITLCEAFDLSETEKEYVSIPTNTIIPDGKPHYPTDPYKITFGTELINPFPNQSTTFTKP